MKFFHRINLGWKSFISMVKGLIDLRDIFVFFGLYMIFHGLHQYIPWVAFSFTGLLLMLIGLGWIDRGRADKGDG